MCTETGSHNGTSASFVVLWEPDQDAIHVGTTAEEITRNLHALAHGAAHTTWLPLGIFATEAAARTFATQAQHLRAARQSRQRKEIAA